MQINVHRSRERESNENTTHIACMISKVRKGANSLPKGAAQLCQTGSRTHDLSIARTPPYSSYKCQNFYILYFQVL